MNFSEVYFKCAVLAASRPCFTSMAEDPDNLILNCFTMCISCSESYKEKNARSRLFGRVFDLEVDIPQEEFTSHLDIALELVNMGLKEINTILFPITFANKHFFVMGFDLKDGAVVDVLDNATDEDMTHVYKDYLSTLRGKLNGYLKRAKLHLRANRLMDIDEPTQHILPWRDPDNIDSGIFAMRHLELFSRTDTGAIDFWGDIVNKGEEEREAAVKLLRMKFNHFILTSPCNDAKKEVDDMAKAFLSTRVRK